MVGFLALQALSKFPSSTSVPSATATRPFRPASAVQQLSSTSVATLCLQATLAPAPSLPAVSRKRAQQPCLSCPTSPTVCSTHLPSACTRALLSPFSPFPQKTPHFSAASLLMALCTSASTSRILSPDRSRNATSSPRSKAPAGPRSFSSPPTSTIGTPPKEPTTTVQVLPSFLKLRASSSSLASVPRTPSALFFSQVKKSY